METLPIELLRIICLELDHQDLFNLFQVNRKCSKIPNEHFWFQQIQYLYPTRIFSKPDDKTWYQYNSKLTYPILVYYDIYKIDSEEKIKYRDCIILHPNYTWKPVESIQPDELTNELWETIQKKQQTEAQYRPTIKDNLDVIRKEPTLVEQLKEMVGKYQFNSNDRKELFFNTLDVNLLFSNETEESIKNNPIKDNLEKIYIVTTKLYQLIALIGKEGKFLINQELYSDSYYMFAVTSDIHIFNNLKKTILNLKMDDEIGLSYLLDGIKYIAYNIIEHKKSRLSVDWISLTYHLNHKVL